MKTSLILAATALLLAACSGGTDENEATITNVEELSPTEQPAPTPEPMPEPTPSPTETTDPLPLEEPVEPDQQVLDDASATGMTARANRDGADQEQPADAAEQQ